MKIKKPKLTNSYFIITLVIVVLYFGYRAVGLLSDPIKTTNAVMVTSDDRILSEGVFIRDETVISGKSGIVQYRASDGEKVSNGAVIADVFVSEEAAGKSRELGLLNKRISNIENAIRINTDASNASRLDNLITLEVTDMAESLDNKVTTYVSDRVDQLKQLMIQRSIAQNGGLMDESGFAQLKFRAEQLTQQVESARTTILTEESGYFSRMVDGMEGRLKTDQIDSLTCASLQQILDQTTEQNTNAFGKIIKGFDWYYATVVPNEEARTLTKGKTVTLRIASAGITGIEVFVHDIRFEGDRAVVILKGTTNSDQIASLRTVSGEIVKRSYTGVKVPKEALRILDGKEGVYVLSGQRAVFKEIKRLYETEEYYVAEANGTDSNGLYIYDEIIIDQKGLTDGKVIR